MSFLNFSKISFNIVVYILETICLYSYMFKNISTDSTEGCIAYVTIAMKVALVS